MSNLPPPYDGKYQPPPPTMPVVTTVYKVWIHMIFLQTIHNAYNYWKEKIIERSTGGEGVVDIVVMK